MRETVSSRKRRSWVTTSTAPGKPDRYRSSQRIPSRSRWFVGSSSSRTVGRDSSTPASITRAACAARQLAEARAVGQAGDADAAAHLIDRVAEAPSVQRLVAVLEGSVRRHRGLVAGRHRRLQLPASRGRRRRPRRPTGAGARPGSDPDREAAARGRRRGRSRPTLTLPASGAARPASRRSSVDLPTPLGPTRPTRSPSARTNETSSKRGSASCAARRASAFNTDRHTSLGPA